MTSNHSLDVFRKFVLANYFLFLELEDDAAFEEREEEPQFEVETEEPSNNEQMDTAYQENELYFSLIQWISIVILRIQCRFFISNQAILAILSLISMILASVSHPLQALFPTTMHQLLKIAHVDVFEEQVIYTVCPDVNCNAIYSLRDSVFRRNGVIISSTKCKKIHYGKECK